MQIKGEERENIETIRALQRLITLLWTIKPEKSSVTDFTNYFRKPIFILPCITFFLFQYFKVSY